MNLYAYVGNDPVNATDPSGQTSRGANILWNMFFRPGRDEAGPTFTLSATFGGEAVAGTVGGGGTRAYSMEITLTPQLTITDLGGFTESASNTDPFYPRGEIAGVAGDFDVGVEFALGSIADQAGWVSSLQVDALVPGGTVGIPESGFLQPGTSVAFSAGIGGGIVGAETNTTTFSLFSDQSELRATGVHEVNGRIESNNLSECGERRCN